MRKQKLISEQIREAIQKSGQTRYSIAKATGVGEPTLSRFCNKKMGLTLQTVDILGQYLGFEIIVTRKEQ